ncbi:mechanosensitive ion channel protein MscS [Enterovibrio norvegicus FF-33]|uniref:Mechanosensitive ion channel protein MscS n=1 Tax=Enterovibrio norvegicus FF-454 TaxID=1185651 RepID=A0A1E5C8F7_9GAMM|nr:mechanosensitive ion channel family protein [Enterovibrio norvegicus]OEE61803.1 mechanosensitive ion channel protein MscS [Enterovibrio norvegicus FF-454]OEE66600.1 mechanosensitive ion channel protein MscS [Enterovibrio norvegicus FF-33]OEE77623.1 mechanosensitive ion channel protein MscS [Enterovibrio norvegicus FF-162]
MEQLQSLITFFSEHKFLLTLLIITVIWTIRRIMIKFIWGDTNFLSEEQRKWISQTKNGSFTILLIVMFLVWQSEINEFALSLTAIAVAVVVASKEIILCFTGSIQRASSRSFQIGEWIEVGSLCGEVIEHNLMATKIQEIDLYHGTYNYTGKTATFPNSLFFTTPVKNLNFMKRYVYHEFKITVKETTNLYPMVPSLLAHIDDHCQDFYEVATRYNHVIERHAGVDLPGADPHVQVTSTDLGDPQVHIRIFCPTERATELEQLIREDFMTLYCERILKHPPIAISEDLLTELESKALHC